MGPRPRPFSQNSGQTLIKLKIQQNKIQTDVALKLCQGSHLKNRKLMISNFYRSEIIWHYYDVIFRFWVAIMLVHKNNDFVQKPGNYTFNTKCSLF